MAMAVSSKNKHGCVCHSYNVLTTTRRKLESIYTGSDIFIKVEMTNN